ncbi:MAG: NAD(P)-binding domain-containing protein [Gemmatimonadaceae bacterium]
MNIAVLGTGTVGATIASKLDSLGHTVKMGSRTANNEKAQAWASQAGRRASHGTFADAAAHGELVFNCTSGAGAVQAIQSAGAANLAGKIVIDLANPLDFSKGMPPACMHRGDDSLAEQIQRAVPDARVVKTLNTINAGVMVDPARVPGDHDVFLSGNDAAAKTEVERILRDWFGWKRVTDLGDLTAARGMELYVVFWVRLWGASGTADFNIRVVK